MKLPTVGLFGTCGKSKWRDPFIKKYKQLQINYFNPQVEDGTWHPGLVEDENFHLVNDEIILFPITDETTGQGSLAEIGFSLLNSIRHNEESRYFVYLIDDHCDDLNADIFQINESNRSRKLVKSKLQKIKYRNVFLTNTLTDMLNLSLDLFSLIIREKKIIKEYKYVGT